MHGRGKLTQAISALDYLRHDDYPSSRLCQLANLTYPRMKELLQMFLELKYVKQKTNGAYHITKAGIEVYESIYYLWRRCNGKYRKDRTSSTTTNPE